MTKEHSEEHRTHGHGNHHAAMITDFRRRFWISLLITLPILVLSPMIQNLLGYVLAFPGESYVQFVLSTAIFFYGGWPFLTGMKEELQDRQPGMMTLIGVAIAVAFGYSSATTFGLEGKTFFWELATLIDVMLLGHWMEMKAVMGASRSLESLAELMPDKAHRIAKNGKSEDVKVNDLRIDDRVQIRPGEKIPADGTITEGSSQVNEAMVTGEARPATKEKGEKVIGGTVNGSGSLTVRVDQAGEDAYLNKVIQMVREAQQKTSRTQRLADRIAFWLTVTALTVGSATLVTWIILGHPFAFALERMASVMVITCPHALGLAVPLVVAISTSVAARKGLLIRNRTAFENARKITLLALDKTGTLTRGEFGVTGVKTFGDSHSEEDILKLAGALESRSEHPLAEGILRRVREEQWDLEEVKDFHSLTGEGVEGKVGDKHVKIVSPGYLKEREREIPDGWRGSPGETVVYVLVNEHLAGTVFLSDEIRKESYPAMQSLSDQNITLYMMTGDTAEVAAHVSEALGLHGYFAGLKPEDKLQKIREFRNRGEYVAMTGDGINDAPALAEADVGIAVGSGTDVAAETADIILVNSDPEDIAHLVRFGKQTHRKMIQNFVWATAYNVVAIPIAAGVLYGAGILINPALGAGLMSVSTLIVAANAQFLRRK